MARTTKKTTKAAETKAKAVETKAAETKAEVVVEEVAEAVETPVVEEKKEVKKAPAKRATKKAVKEEVKVEETAKVETKATLETTVTLQFADKSYTEESLTAIAKDVWTFDLNQNAEELKTVELYVKPEEGLCYYVFNGDVTGSFVI